MQWLSPAFPLSSYAYSHGLESAVESGWLHSADSLYEWLFDLLLSGAGKNDAIWIRLAAEVTDAAELVRLNDEARALQISAERLRETQKQGHAFAKTVEDVWGIAVPMVCLPLAVGFAAKQSQLSADDVIPLYLQAMTSNLVAAAQRLLPIGQTEGQRILARLQPEFVSLATATLDARLEDICSHNFLSDVAAMKHETLQGRIFQS